MAITTACSRCGRSRPCHAHDGLDAGRRRAKAHRNGLHTAGWKRLRAQALARDGYVCRLGLPGCTVRAATVHLHPGLGGDHRRATLADCVSACHHCHGVLDAPRATRSAA